MKDRLAVILVEPKYGLNIGYVARVMKNFGIEELYIVGRDDIPRSAFKFSSHAKDVIKKAKLVGHLNNIVKNFDFVIGTTARTAVRSGNVIRKSTEPEEVLQFLDKFDKVALVLGRDTTGLKNEELALCDVVVTIPTGTSYRTMNISHALAVLLYVFSRRKEKRRVEEFPTRKEREQLTIYIDQIMESIKFPKYRRLRVVKTFNKIAISELKKKDLVTLLGFFRRILIKLQEKHH